MAYADYDFYTTSYFGSVVPEADFDRLAARASDFIDTLTFDNLVDGLAKELEVYRDALQDTRNQLENAKVELETPFAKEKELAEKSKRLKELNILLNMDQTEKMLLDDVLEEKSFENKKQHDIQR